MDKVYLVITGFKVDYEYEQRTVVGVAIKEEDKDRLVLEAGMCCRVLQKDSIKWRDHCIACYKGRTKDGEALQIYVYYVPVNMILDI
jgi:hypothetical protein